MRILPGALSGTWPVPPAKSYTQRALLLAALAKGTSYLKGVGQSEDEQAMCQAIVTLGAKVVPDSAAAEANWRISSPGLPLHVPVLNCFESGLALRLLTPIAALGNQWVGLEASGSLRTRPQHFFEELLPALGVQIASQNGYPPLHVKGPLRPRNLTLDTPISSQFISGLLIAYAAIGAPKPYTIEVQHLPSSAYVALTLALLKAFGVAVKAKKKGHTWCYTLPAKAKLCATDLQIEKDWSAAAVWLTAAALRPNNSLSLSGLAPHSLQADRKILGILKHTGCTLSHTKENLSLKSPSQALRAFAADLKDAPDLFPPLVALATACKGTSQLSGLNRLTYKESNRKAQILSFAQSLGLRCQAEGDRLSITGQSTLQGNCTLNSANDHRMAMLATLLGLRSEKGIVVEKAEVVAKSFPKFFTLLEERGHSQVLHS